MSNDVSKTSRSKFALILFVFALPVIISYLAYYVWPPAGGVKNYGELIKGATLSEQHGLTGMDGKPLPTLRGKWWLVMVDSGQCNAACEKKLYAMRQVRLMQGREMDRVARLWVVSDAVVPDMKKLQQFEGTVMARDVSGSATARLPVKADVRDHLYIVDPLGNVVLRYGPDPDLKRMKKDLELLLRASQIG